MLQKRFDVYIIPYLFRFLLAFGIAGLLKLAMQSAINNNYSMMCMGREERDRQLEILDKLFFATAIVIAMVIP